MPKDVAGLTDAVARAPERTPVRTRDSNVTRSAWRMEVECGAASGAITFLETDGLYRGDGLFLGWPQERLAEAYQGLLESDDEPPFEPMQLG